MANFFVAYDLMAPGQNYPKVEAAVKSLGTACKLLNTTWYLKSSSTLKHAHDTVRAVMDQNDKLMVIDANNCHVSKMPDACWKIACDNWNT